MTNADLAKAYQLDINELNKPLENLTAEEARSCKKIFDGLTYSPEDANKAQEIAESISKAARLGFGEVSVKEKYRNEMPEKIISLLKENGFVVGRLYKGIYVNDCDFFTDVSGYTDVIGSAIIQWDTSLSLPHLKEGEFLSYEEAETYAKQLQSEYLGKMLQELEETKLIDNKPEKPKQSADEEIPAGCAIAAVALLILAMIGCIFLW